MVGTALRIQVRYVNCIDVFYSDYMKQSNARIVIKYIVRIC